MSKSSKDTLKIASVYIGTVLGAGFASGQELIQFFTSYGFHGIYGLILSGILFSLIGWAILEISYTYKTHGYNEFINPIMGRFLGDLMQKIIIIYLFIEFIVMLAGSGALFEQYFKGAFTYGVILMAFFCLVTFMYGVKGIVVVNSILAPILLIGGIILGIYIVIFRDVATMGIIEMVKKFTDNWITSSVLYVSYNTIPIGVVLASMGTLIPSKTSARRGGILGGTVLGFLGLCLGAATLIFYMEIKDVEIPMLKIVSHYSIYIQYIYIAILIAAMFTTAVAGGYGFIDRVCAISKWNRKKFTISFVVVACVLSHIGFSNLVQRAFPLFGYIGIFQFVLILLYFLTYKMSKVKWFPLRLENTPRKYR